jgi:hypothetical protein
MLQHPYLKEIQLIMLKLLAGEYGFNYDYYEKMGVWATNKEIENGKEGNPFTAVYDPKKEVLKCKGCSKNFDKRKENQKFCNLICKNRFHNSKKV